MTAYVYRHFGADGTLLYIGISLNAVARLSHHRRHAPWFKKIARVYVQRFATRHDAERAECEAINSEKPKFNLKKRSKARTMTRNAAYATFDVTLRNPRNAWSGRKIPKARRRHRMGRLLRPQHWRIAVSLQATSSTEERPRPKMARR
jgi:predicted GIY-YIG superfamily endonuclease